MGARRSVMSEARAGIDTRDQNGADHGACDDEHNRSHVRCRLFLCNAIAWPIFRRLRPTVERAKSLAKELTAKNVALVKASEVKNCCLASLGHDLRTPLNAMGVRLGFMGRPTRQWR